ncbi:T-cell-specific surface glycoprotein CD28-like [Archocentrus centrarchus]|uniref:T-cell-specific surface glycoprotein CD28-like n=1 Tax=Archocentrus centrarchus TaxID=63155 RepID=UPI0011EA2458|nr:T-cell-specific surface glycoprotein CD28-like [Archocentrus centrarchus]
MIVGVLCMVVMVCFSAGEGTYCSDGPVPSVPKSAKVMVSCPSFQASEIKYQLFFNKKLVTKVGLNKNHTAQFEVTASESGVYCCMMETIYPPPYKQNCKTTQVNVTDEKPLSSINASVTPVKSCACKPPLIPEVVMWGGCGALLVYSLTITCITIAIWKKQKKKEMDTVVYENTRPRDFKKPSKV